VNPSDQIGVNFSGAVTMQRPFRIIARRSLTAFAGELHANSKGIGHESLAQ
jgi:hypothetical protein